MGPVEWTESDRQADRFFAGFANATPELIAGIASEQGGDLAEVVAEEKAFGYWDRKMAARAARRAEREQAEWVDQVRRAAAFNRTPDETARLAPLPEASAVILPEPRFVILTDPEYNETPPVVASPRQPRSRPIRGPADSAGSPRRGAPPTPLRAGTCHLAAAATRLRARRMARRDREPHQPPAAEDRQPVGRHRRGPRPGNRHRRPAQAHSSTGPEVTGPVCGAGASTQRRARPAHSPPMRRLPIHARQCGC